MAFVKYSLLSQFSFGFTIRGAVIAQLEEILEIRFRFRVELGNNGSVKSQCQNSWLIRTLNSVIEPWVFLIAHPF